MMGMVLTAIHTLVVVWALVSPFSKWKFLRVSYVIFAPFLMLHWLLNDDTCVLTKLECAARGLDDCSDSYVHRIVSPVYKISDASMRTAAWTFTIVAWAYAASSVSFRDIVAFFTS